MSPWITAELVADTIATWRPYYGKELTESEAVAILQTFGRLIDILEQGP